MAHRRGSAAARRLLPGVAVVMGAALFSACSGQFGDQFQPMARGSGGSGGGSAGAGGGTSGSGNGGGTATGAGGTVVTPMPCDGDEVLAPKRLVRLSFNQLANTVRSLLGNEFGDQVVTTFGIGDATARTFPPLLSPREGLVLIDQKWEVGDNVANAAGAYVSSHFAAVTGCATVTDACARQFLGRFAEKAYRRPLAAAEGTALTQLYTDLEATLQDPATPTTSPIQDAVQYAVYAIMSTPAFLYRSELGTGGAEAGTLTPYELADQLAYFLTDAPADPPLLDAARAGRLTNDADVAAQADRLLAGDAAKLNLQQAIFAYFSLQFLDTVIIDAAKVPGISVDTGLFNSMYTESERFLDGRLWGGPLSDLITSRSTSINDRLAQLYGVTPFPPPGATADAAGFVDVTLPDSRAGLLTQAGFLTARARPNVPSVVARGLAVNAFMLCATNPPFPEDLKPQIDMVQMMLANETERTKAAYRADKSRPCSGCHPNFDPYGLSLENFDIIGRYRTVDELNRPIDASVTLPANAGGGLAANAAEMGRQIAQNGAFAKCMARNFIQFALADGQPVPINGCAVDAVNKRFSSQPAAEQTFSNLLREIAVSKTLALRTAGGT